MTRIAVLVLLVAAMAARQAHGRHPLRQLGARNDTVVTGGGDHRKCHYQLFVKTEDKYGAGTDSNIKFELFSEDNSVIIFSMDGSQDGSTFEMGTTTTVPNDTVWCMHPCRITVTSDGKGDWPSWRCESVRVDITGDVQEDETFQVSQWIGPGKDESMSVTVDKCAKPVTAVASS